MSEVKLDKKGNFIVRESIVTNIIIGYVFLIMFGLALYNYHRETIHIYDKSGDLFHKILLLTSLPAIGYFFKAATNRAIITVNQNGIYCYDKLKTNWQNFIRVYLIEKQKTGSIEDHFYLVLEFYKENEEGYFECEIPMTNTQNKGDEEIIAAIEHFRNTSLKQTK